MDVTESNFQQVVNGNALVLLDAWAPWCQPCKRMDPILDELVAQAGGKVVLAKLNTDENEKLASQLSIQGMPTYIFYRNGKRVDQVSGFTPKPQMEARMQRAFGI
ncbi:MAG: thioredoxin 1 [Thermoplasmata archaeon]|jgi:thioredoxin|nr:thioredoxin 1 [Thermoplasmata archaeon]